MIARRWAPAIVASALMWYGVLRIAGWLFGLPE
jgi:hypothetical protein